MNRREFILSSAALAIHHKGSAAHAEALRGGPPVSDAALRYRLMHDPLRPQYHLLPQAGFVGDPCAPRFYRGLYHVFYHGSFGGRGWHHSACPDLMHWRHMPIALSPAANSSDSYGTFTGSVLPEGEGAQVIYTGVTKVSREQETIRNEGLKEVQCIAMSTDGGLKTWHKLDKPVIEGPPAGMKVVGFRDPFSWKEGDTWYVGVGSGFSQIGGAVLLYRSKDARHFEYLHPLATGTWNGEQSSNPVPSGEMWECPDFFPLGDKHVLIYSSEHTTFWEVGEYDDHEHRFHAKRKGILDWGAFYAPKTMLDGKRRRILWGWVQETRSSQEIEAAGWAGCISLPRVLTLGHEGELQMEVASELASLETNRVMVSSPKDPSALKDALSRAIIHNRAGVISCVFEVGESSFGLNLRSGSQGNADSLLSITYNGANNQPHIAVGEKEVPLSPDSDGFSSLHICIDASVIETIVDKRQAITTRCYATSGDSGEVHLGWDGAADSLKSLEVSDIKPISDDRLTS